MYYNEKLKQEYIDQVLSTGRLRVPTLVSLFSKLADYEEEKACDIGDMTKKDIVEGLNSRYVFMQPPSAKGVVIQLNNYRKWYSSTHDPEPIAISDIDFVSAYRKNLFRSWNDVLTEMDGYDFQQGDETGAAIALAWLGYKLSDSTMLLEEQVDWKNGLIFDKFGNVVIREIEPKVLRVLSDYKSQIVGTRKRNHYEKVSMIQTGYFLHRMDVENTARDNEGKPVRIATVSNKILQIAESYTLKTGNPYRLSASNVWYSGTYLRLYEYMSAHNTDNDKSIRIKIKEITQIPQLSMPEAKLIFESYKKAFNLE